jgi:hypothetical protein
MVVSKQAYTVSAPWLNFNLADQFKLAFIDAGLMDDWFDTFEDGPGSSSGERFQHRVIKIVYDASKKYGTVYHWFTFRPNGFMSYAYTHQWDPVGHVPLGVKRKERLEQTYSELTGATTAVGSHRRFATQVLSTTTTLTRYSSGVKSKFSMFLLKGGNNFQCFFLMPPGTKFQPYVNLDLNTCGGLVVPIIGVSSTGVLTSATQQYVAVNFDHFFHYKDNIFAYGYSGRADRDWSIMYSNEHGVSYALAGGGTSDIGFTSSNNLTISARLAASEKIENTYTTTSASNGFLITLPCELAVDNQDRETDSTPVFSDLPYSLYIADRLPIDFGIVGHFTNNTMEVQDIFQVTPGVEEWEILANMNLQNSRNPSALVVARII